MVPVGIRSDLRAGPARCKVGLRPVPALPNLILCFHFVFDSETLLMKSVQVSFLL